MVMESRKAFELAQELEGFFGYSHCAEAATLIRSQAVELEAAQRDAARYELVGYFNEMDEPVITAMPLRKIEYCRASGFKLIYAAIAAGGTQKNNR
jgi:hypothetical protein